MTVFTVTQNFRASDDSRSIKAIFKQVFVLLRGGESHRISRSLSLVPIDGETCQHKERAFFSSRFLRGDHYLPQHKDRSASFALYFHAFGFRNRLTCSCTYFRSSGRFPVGGLMSIFIWCLTILRSKGCLIISVKHSTKWRIFRRKLKDVKVYSPASFFPSEQRRSASLSSPARDSQELQTFLCFFHTALCEFCEITVSAEHT